MCFYPASTKEGRIPHKATKDIPCWKIVLILRTAAKKKRDALRRCYAPYYSFIYQRNKTYAINFPHHIVNISSNPDHYFVVEKGFHSFANVTKAKRECVRRRGYFLSTEDQIAIVQGFTIPKGSTYFYNPYSKEYVSNQIIWKGCKNGSRRVGKKKKIRKAKK